MSQNIFQGTPVMVAGAVMAIASPIVVLSMT